MFDVEKTSDLIQKSKDGDKDALDALKTRRLSSRS